MQVTTTQSQRKATGIGKRKKLLTRKERRRFREDVAFELPGKGGAREGVLSQEAL